MARWNWIEKSKIEWGHDETPNDIGRYVEIGALQRIAIAMERIADLMDPQVQKKIRAAEKRAEQFDAYLESKRKYIEPALRILDKKIADLPRTIRKRLFGHINLAHRRIDEVYTRTDWQIAMRFAKEFDVATYPWDAVPLTVNMRAKLEKIISQNKNG